MKGLGEGIAFFGFVLAAAWLEVSGDGAGLLWVLVICWALFSDWGQKL